MITIDTNKSKTKWISLPCDESVQFEIEPMKHSELSMMMASFMTDSVTNQGEDGENKEVKFNISPEKFSRIQKMTIMKNVKGFRGFSDQNGKEVVSNVKNKEMIIEGLWQKDVSTKDENGNNDKTLTLANFLYENITKPESIEIDNSKN